MSAIEIAGHRFNTVPRESVLDCLLRHGYSIPFSCRNGVCQTCLMRLVKGKIPADAQKGLRETQKIQNYFLPCACQAEEDIEIALPDTPPVKTTTYVVEKKLLAPKIMRLRLAIPTAFSYEPGQYVNLHLPQLGMRSYSLASLPEQDNFLEFHIALKNGGKISTWIHTRLSAGDSVDISMPMGECFYTSQHLNQPLLLIGTISGLSPLYGILRRALKLGHRGPIQLYHGSHNQDGLYLMEELTRLCNQYANLSYRPCSSREKLSAPFLYGRASELALAQHTNLSGWRLYLCGNAEMVNTTRLTAFLAGASLQDIHSDSFL